MSNLLPKVNLFKTSQEPKSIAHIFQ